MANILINGLKAHSGGGKNILLNILINLTKFQTSHFFYVLVPKIDEYLPYESKNVKVLTLSNIYKSNIFFPFLYYYKLPLFLTSLKIDLIFNLGDVILPNFKRQIYFYDWAYLLYDYDYIWNNMPWKDKILRKIKLQMIKKELNNVDLIIVQTVVGKKRFEVFYQMENIIVIPTPVSVPDDIVINYRIYNEKFGIDSLLLFYPAYFAPHKNHKIIFELAELIKLKNLDIKILLTLPNNVFTRFIRDHQYNSIITNIGPTDYKTVHSVYEVCDGVLIPSLLESYGIPYFEAMAHKKPILTSDLDFAHAACKDAAIYFNPFSAEDILNTIIKTFNSRDTLNKIVQEGEKIYNSLPSWNDVIAQFLLCIDETLKKP